MLVLIRKDKKGNQHYIGIKNETQLEEYLRSEYGNFRDVQPPINPQLNPIEVPDKKGQHYIASNRNNILSKERHIFVCDESELTEEEKEKVQKNGE